MRRAGVLLPVFSLPSEHGIGSFSKEAYDFVDILAESGQKLWQILPIGPVAYGDSPYQSPSTFAGNFMYIDLEKLIEEKLLTKKECKDKDFGDDPSRVNYDKVREGKRALLELAFSRALPEQDRDYVDFVTSTDWLEDYATYCALKEHFSGKPWYEWDEAEIAGGGEDIERSKRFHKYVQYLFMKQWMALKQYANDKGVLIVGDLPIYVAYDSADCFANRELFQLNEDNTPKAVAGCPPDAFCPDGQHWGNPLYDWDRHRETGYGWWIRRIDHCRKMFDIVRIDHFRGFDSYYSIPYGAASAAEGHWEQGPGLPFFKMLSEWFGEVNIIAEDLGYLTESVVALVRDTGYPGMRILQFAFDESHESTYLPHKYDRNCVVYTGTHDNNTTLGWYEELNDTDREYVADYINTDSGKPKKVVENLVRLAMSSVADTAIVPLQDYLLLDAGGRTNVPGTVGGNWSFRVTKAQLKKFNSVKVKFITELYGR
ncbi:MAG: 4-alpha-glucanotransferase [Lachnospiraceae bacterium]|nr:4-alpha-glucanotransferase [Lachnospiraceae bacterium]